MSDKHGTRCLHCGPVAPEHFRDEVHVQQGSSYTRDDMLEAVFATFDFMGVKMSPEGAREQYAARIVDKISNAR